LFGGASPPGDAASCWPVPALSLTCCLASAVSSRSWPAGDSSAPPIAPTPPSFAAVSDSSSTPSYEPVSTTSPNPDSPGASASSATATRRVYPPLRKYRTACTA
jgi:hypothetical protein